MKMLMYICELRKYKIHEATIPSSKPAKHKKKLGGENTDFRNNF